MKKYIITALVCTSCSQIPECHVNSMVNERIDKEVFWGKYDIQNLLKEELTPDTAVRIALLNNPDIQATFEDVGIAQADLIQAGLLQNPIFEGMVRFPNKKHAVINTQFSLTQNFLDLLLIPLRKRIAAAELEQAQLKVVQAVLNLAFEVQETYYSLLTDQIQRDLLKPVVELSEVEYKFAKRQLKAGNINGLDYLSRKNEYLDIKVDYSRNEKEVIRNREQLIRLLGLTSCEITLAKKLPELPVDEPSIECLEEIALSQRVDLEIARNEIERIAMMYGIKEWWAYTNAAMGVSSERDPENITSTGPTLSFEIPLFNYGQADRARISAMFAQSIDRFKSIEIQVLAEVRSARDQLQVNRELATAYRDEIIPLQKQIVASSQKYSNAMAISVFKLLNAKKNELQMEINYHLSLRDYWIARTNLDRALGGTWK